MGAADKDRAIKRQAMSFCLSQGLLPYIEVPIVEATQLQRKVLLTTDIDVLGLGFEWTGKIRRTLFDCKTSKESPINRALWAAGVVSHLRLDDGYVIVKRAAAPTHKLSAEERSIYLFDEPGFQQFAKFYDPSPAPLNAYLTDLSRQDEIDGFFGEKHPLYGLSAELVKVAPLESDSGLGLRRVLAGLRKSREELDPAKSGHVYLFCEAVAAAGLFLVDFLARIVRLLGAKSDQREFEEVAKFLVWGGRQAYEDKVALRQLLLPNLEQGELDFPAWPEFLRATSILIVGLNTVSRVPLAMRNLGMRYVGGPKAESEPHMRALLVEDARLRQAVFVILRYVRVASDIPKDFVRIVESDINDLLNGKPAAAAAG